LEKRVVSETNRQWLLAARPVGMVETSNFELRTVPVAEPADGQLLVRNRWLACEPAMRGWLEDRPNDIPPVELGEVMRGMISPTTSKRSRPAQTSASSCSSPEPDRSESGGVP
jgi:hypothetical protein